MQPTLIRIMRISGEIIQSLWPTLIELFSVDIGAIIVFEKKPG